MLLKRYGVQKGFMKFIDKILSLGVCVEPEASSMPACKGERGCQGLKDVERNSKKLTETRIL